MRRELPILVYSEWCIFLVITDQNMEVVVLSVSLIRWL